MTTHFTWQSAVLDSDRESTTKLVLLAIGSFMNQHGTGAFPSLETLSAKTSLSKLTVMRHVKVAEESGWLCVKKRYTRNGDKDSNLYSIQYPINVVSQVNHGGIADIPRVVSPVNRNTPVVTPQVTPQTHTEALPDWIPEETWKGFEEMRQKIRKPLTDRAKKMIFAKLDEFRKDGHEPKDVLEQSIVSAWSGVFPLKKMAEAKPVKDAPWWSSNEAMLKKGRELGLQPRSGESWNDFRGRIDKKMGGAA